MWQRADYEKTAVLLAQQYVASDGKTSLNSLVTKVASENNLNPEQIRTVARLANVSAFEQLFAKRAAEKAPDRMIEFELGDPETVINSLYSSAKQAAVSQDGTVKTAYDRTTDFWSDLVRPPEAEIVKEAAVEEEDIVVQKPQLKLVVKEAMEKVRIEKHRHTHIYMEAMEKSATLLKQLYGSSLQQSKEGFEKNAVASLGEAIAPELYILNALTGGELTDSICGGVKLASITEKHLAIPSEGEKQIYTLFKKAQDARGELKKSASCLEKLNEYFERLD